MKARFNGTGIPAGTGEQLLFPGKVLLLRLPMIERGCVSGTGTVGVKDFELSS